MKPLTLFRRPVSIVYKHSICSLAALIVLALTVATVLVPFYTTFGLNGDLWMTQNQHRVELQQPAVMFAFRYIVLGEFRVVQDTLGKMEMGDNATDTFEGEDDILAEAAEVEERDAAHIKAFTSYPFLNEMLRQQRHSVAIKHWTTDLNHDGRADQIHLQFVFECPPKATSMSFLSLFLDLDARLDSAQSCSLKLPAAIAIDRLPLPLNEITPGTELNLAGRLRFRQRSSFSCPNWLQTRQTHFHKLHLISPNSTDVDEYAIASIGSALRSNIGYLEFEAAAASGLHWQSVTNASPNDRRNRINVVIHIDEVAVRYWTSMGQQVFRMWMEYLAVLVVLVVVVDRLKAFVFSGVWLRTWEVQPWKQKTN